MFTAADVPGELRVGLIHKDWPVFIPDGGRTSYLGDVLAVVVADDRVTARAAAELVEVDYEVLPAIADPDAAVAPVPRRGCGSSTATCCRAPPTPGATSRPPWPPRPTSSRRRSRPSASSTPSSSPSRRSPCPADDGGLHVYSGGQGVWDDRDQIASLLGVDTARVTVQLVSNGGAFGGKEDMANQAQTALAAWLLGRPVKCTLSREESLLIHPKRHPIPMRYRAGCDADGQLTALRVRMIGDSGPYASVGMKVLERAAGHASGPYHLPTIDVEAVAVRTNNPVCGAFRGFGANQAQFAMEGVLDRLAEEVGISGWEIRSRNVIDPGVEWGPGQIMDDGCLGARECLDAVKPHYDEARAAGKAVGLGLGLKNSGLGNGFVEIAQAVVRFEEDGTVEVRHCWTEMGQGVHTVALQVAVEELGVDPARIRVVVDTTRELGAGQTTGSRGTLMGAGSVADACEAALADGCRTGVDYQGEYRVDWTNHLGEPGVEHPVIHSTFGYAAQLVVIDRETRCGRAGRRRPRRRPGRQPAAVRGPDRGGGPHGPRLRPHRGLPGRRRRPAHRHDAAVARHPPGQGRAGDRGHPRRVAPAQRALRHQGRRRDRPRAHRGRGGRRPPRARRRLAAPCPCARHGGRRRDRRRRVSGDDVTPDDLTPDD